MLGKDNLLLVPIIRSETWISKMVTAGTTWQRLLVNVLDCVNRWLVPTYVLFVRLTVQILPHFDGQLAMRACQCSVDRCMRKYSMWGFYSPGEAYESHEISPMFN